MKVYINIILAMALLAVGACAKSSVRTVKAEPADVYLERALASREAAQVAEQRVYFPFASDFILSEVVEKIDKNIEWLKNNPLSYIILEGHCDEVGQSEYNMQLGDRRARAVKAYMIERGILPERIIMVVSYGSQRPLNPGHTIEDLRENRRVEFVIR